jgi:hypothetical protein
MKSRDRKTAKVKPIPSEHTQGEAKAQEKSKAKRESKRIPKLDIKASAVW